MYLMHIKWLYFVPKHHIIKNSFINLLSTSNNQYESRISKNITNICCDFFSNYSKLRKKAYGPIRNLGSFLIARYWEIIVKKIRDIRNSYWLLDVLSQIIRTKSIKWNMNFAWSYIPIGYYLYIFSLKIATSMLEWIWMSRPKIRSFYY